ncbi:MAG: hypothetical protein PHQ34_04085 [Methanothrix sp.]|nr:hypothetical protein [Methanothrix sp.]
MGVNDIYAGAKKLFNNVSILIIIFLSILLIFTIAANLPEVFKSIIDNILFKFVVPAISIILIILIYLVDYINKKRDLDERKSIRSQHMGKKKRVIGDLESRIIKNNFIFMLVISILIALSLIILSNAKFSDIWLDSIRQIGIAVLIASTIGILSSEYYRKMREHNFHDELWQSVDQLRDLNNAGILSVYPNRGGEAVEDVRTKLENLQKGQVRILGSTLRVFFHSGQDYAATVHKIIDEKRAVEFKVLLMNINTKEALYRAVAESECYFENDSLYQECAQCMESKGSIKYINILNENYRKNANESAQNSKHKPTPCRKKNNIEAIESKDGKDLIKDNNPNTEKPICVRLYNNAPYCLLIMFDDVCYTSQYIYGDHNTQVNTVKLPLIKYQRDSDAYKNFEFHFEYIWKNAAEIDEMEVNLFDKCSKCSMRGKSILFTWNEITGDDERKFKDLLENKYNINGIKKLCKNKEGNEIIIEKDGENLHLKLNDSEDKATEANIEIDGNRPIRFIAKNEEGKLKIYERCESHIEKAILIPKKVDGKWI